MTNIVAMWTHISNRNENKNNKLARIFNQATDCYYDDDIL